MESCSGLQAAKKQQPKTVGVMLFSWNALIFVPDVPEVFQKVQLLSCQSNEHLALCSFWSVVVFTWILTLTACSSLNVVLGSFVSSWLSHQCATKLQTLQMALWSSPDWQMLLTLLLSVFYILAWKAFPNAPYITVWHNCMTPTQQLVLRGLKLSICSQLPCSMLFLFTCYYFFSP